MEVLIIRNLSGLCRNEELLYGAHFDLLEDEAFLSKYNEEELSEDHPLLKKFIIKKMQLDKEARFFIFDHHKFELNPQPLDICHTVKKSLDQITPIMFTIDPESWNISFAKENNRLISNNINNYFLLNQLLSATERNFNLLVDLYVELSEYFYSLNDLYLNLIKTSSLNRQPLLEKIQTLHDFYFKE